MHVSFMNESLQRYLEQRFAFSWEFLGNVLLPRQEGLLLDDLHIVQVDKVAQQHACKQSHKRRLSLESMAGANATIGTVTAVQACKKNLPKKNNNECAHTFGERCGVAVDLQGVQGADLQVDLIVEELLRHRFEVLQHLLLLVQLLLGGGGQLLFSWLVLSKDLEVYELQKTTKMGERGNDQDLEMQNEWLHVSQPGGGEKETSGGTW